MARRAPITPRHLPFRTVVGDMTDLPVPGTKFHPPNPIRPQYTFPEDVPLPLRHTLKYAHDSGLEIDMLADVYELPREWVALFCSPVGVMPN